MVGPWWGHVILSGQNSARTATCDETWFYLGGPEADCLCNVTKSALVMWCKQVLTSGKHVGPNYTSSQYRVDCKKVTRGLVEAFPDLALNT